MAEQASGLQEIDEPLISVVDPVGVAQKGEGEQQVPQSEEEFSALSSGDRLEEELDEAEESGGRSCGFVEKGPRCGNGDQQSQQLLCREQLKNNEAAPTDRAIVEIPELSSQHHKHWQQMKEQQRRQPVDSSQLEIMHQQGHTDRLTLSIGGILFETSSQTLCVDSNSMLAAYVLRHLNPGEVLWFDRDGRRFQYVLNYLRNGTIWLEDVSTLREVQEEAEFYGLNGLQALCEERIRDIQQKAEANKSEQLEVLRQTWRETLREIQSTFRAFQSSNDFQHSKGSSPSLNRGRTRTRDEPVFDMNDEQIFDTGADF